jgi:diguanylate cyclase (GGDEF)-like protein/PAS domain S-box-containing protein
MKSKRDHSNRTPSPFINAAFHSNVSKNNGGNNICDTYSLSEIKDMVFDALIGTDTDSIYIKDCHGRFNIVNRRVIHEMGINSLDEIIGKTDKELFGEEFGSRTEKQEQPLYNNGEPIAGVVEWREDTPSNRYWTSTTKIPLTNDAGEVVGLIGITRNISEIKIHEQNLQYMATHDPLTGIYNRIGLLERLQEFTCQPDNTLAVLAIDIDNFKQINDHYYHKAGDEFLKWFSWILKSSLRGNDIVARLGGDEFIVIMENIADVDSASSFCKKLYNNFEASIENRMRKIGVGISVGISIFPNDSNDPNYLLDKADEALYFVKQNSKGHYQYYLDLNTPPQS